MKIKLISLSQPSMEEPIMTKRETDYDRIVFLTALSLVSKPGKFVSLGFPTINRVVI